MDDHNDVDLMKLKKSELIEIIEQLKISNETEKDAAYRRGKCETKREARRMYNNYTKGFFEDWLRG